jgi:hypothetical protein
MDPDVFFFSSSSLKTHPQKKAKPKIVHFVFECTEPFFAFFFAFLASDRLGLQVS